MSWVLRSCARVCMPMTRARRGTVWTGVAYRHFFSEKRHNGVFVGIFLRFRSLIFALISGQNSAGPECPWPFNSGLFGLKLEWHYAIRQMSANGPNVRLLHVCRWVRAISQRSSRKKSNIIHLGRHHVCYHLLSPVMLCRRCIRPHCGFCPSVRPSVCPTARVLLS